LPFFAILDALLFIRDLGLVVIQLS